MATEIPAVRPAGVGNDRAISAVCIHGAHQRLKFVYPFIHATIKEHDSQSAAFLGIIRQPQSIFRTGANIP